MVVGGLALAYWSNSDEFITGDIDVVVPRLPELPERLAALGFAQQGREWILPGYDVSFEAPGEVLEPGDVEAGRFVEEWEIAELGKDIEGQSYSADDE